MMSIQIYGRGEPDVNILKLILMMSVTAISFNSKANTGLINFTGKVYDDTCILSVADVSTGIRDMRVSLDSLTNAVFTPTEHTAGSIDFSLHLTNADGKACHIFSLFSSMNPVITVTAHSLAVTSDGTLLTNQAATANTEHPVYLQILARASATDEGTAIDFTNASGQSQAKFDSNLNRFYYTAYYQAGFAATRPALQQVSAAITYNLTYP